MDLLSLAKDVAARVEAKAAEVKVPVAVCVTDIHGNIVLKHRMGGAPAFSIDIAERSSTWCNRDSRCLRLSDYPAGDTARWVAGYRSPATARWWPVSG
jgi:hypothetical protein